MKPAVRKGLVLGALAATGAAAYFAPPPPDDAVESERPRPSAAHVEQSRRDEPRTRRAATADDAVEVLRPRAEGEGQDILAALVPALPPSAPPQAPTPATMQRPAQPVPAGPPMPPPLPFQVAGRVSDGRGDGVFLVFNERDLIVHAGDPIGTDYIVSAITADQMTFEYKPLGVSQTITLMAFQ